MVRTRRQVILASGLALLAGCSSNTNEQQQTERTPTENETGDTSTETQQPATTTTGPESELRNPDATRSFGESYVDTDLEITVERPTLTTSFTHDGDRFELPDGSALALTPVEFHNTHPREGRPIDGPLFTLIAGELTRLETHSIDHPAFDPSIRTRNMDGIPTTGRWNSHGANVDPGERLDGTAVFPVTEATDPATLSIVYDSNRIHDDRFGDTTVEWSH